MRNSFLCGFQILLLLGFVTCAILINKQAFQQPQPLTQQNQVERKLTDSRVYENVTQVSIENGKLVIFTGCGLQEEFDQPMNEIKYDESFSSDEGCRIVVQYYETGKPDVTLYAPPGCQMSRPMMMK